VEQRIEQLKSDLAAADFCLHEFFVKEAAFLGILMPFNLLGEFQRASGLSGYRRPATLRVQVFLCGAILARAGHRVVLHLSAAWGGYHPIRYFCDLDPPGLRIPCLASAKAVGLGLPIVESDTWSYRRLLELGCEMTEPQTESIDYAAQDLEWLKGLAPEVTALFSVVVGWLKSTLVGNSCEPQLGIRAT